MKYTRRLSLLFLFLLAGTAFLSAQRHPRELSEPAPIRFTPPKPVVFTLSNGIQVYFLEDRELPLVNLSAYFSGGAIHEPADKTGLASMTGTVMRSGGTPTHPGDQLDEALEFLSASVETRITDEYAFAGANCLRKDLSTVLDIFADVIMNPAFPADKIELAKNQSRDAIRRRWDQPMTGANLLFTEALLGGSPWGRRTTAKTLTAITRDDLVTFHHSVFAPNNMYIGVSGDLSRDEARTMLEQAFKGWARHEVKLPSVPELTEKADGTIFYAYKDTPQANVMLGHLGARNHVPEEAALDVLNEVFGGDGFTTRLMREVRSNRGLTYGIYGGVYTGTDRGLFRISSQIKANHFVEAVQIVRGIINDLKTKPVGEEEIRIAKNSLINGFAFQFERQETIPDLYILNKMKGYPENYFDTYVASIEKLTRADLQSAAQKYMDPDKMIVTVVGDEKRFDQPLSTLGKVKTIDYQAKAESDRKEN